MRMLSAVLSTAVLGLVFVDSASAQYQQTNLVSDGSVSAALVDPNLKNPWGISFATGGAFWISDQASNFSNPSTGIASSVSTLLTVPASGSAPSIPGLIVNVPNQANAGSNIDTNGTTGQVATGASGITTIASDFQVVGPDGAPAHKASFIFANLDGSISAWAGGNAGTPIPNTTGTLETTTVVAGASFTGLAIANNPSAAIGGASGAQIYAADQNSGNISVFNASWQKVETFTDPNLPTGYTAFNVQNLNGILYVTFANQGSTVGGIVDEFAPDGTFLKRLIDNSTATTAHGNLDQPWGLALAPSTFGPYGGDLLVGNDSGDGGINAYNPTTGAWAGELTLNNGQLFSEGNLWALTFGTGGSSGSPNTLYFAAGLDSGTNGLVGAISFVPEPSPAWLLGLGGALVVVAQYGRKRMTITAA